MSGYIQITSKNLTTDLDEVVNLVLSRKVLLDEANVPESNSHNMMHQQWQRGGRDDYHVSLHFTNYQKSEVLPCPSSPSLSRFPPTNYSMDITGDAQYQWCWDCFSQYHLETLITRTIPRPTCQSELWCDHVQRLCGSTSRDCDRSWW